MLYEVITVVAVVEVLLVGPLRVGLEVGQPGSLSSRVATRVLIERVACGTVWDSEQRAWRLSVRG